MSENVLVTGGAGFIGSFLVEALLEDGHTVRVLDSLDPQVHGPGAAEPECIAGRVEFIRADVGDRAAVDRALEGIDVVFHEAAAVGVGQSMYEIAHYVRANTLGAAVLLEAVAARATRPRKLIVASSMSIYGEGAYECAECGPFVARMRPDSRMSERKWEMPCAACGRDAEPRPTAESKPLAPTSTYAVTKRDHEELFLAVGAAYHVPAVALRYFNVYGPRQALSNPYTGVAAIFSSRLLAGKRPVVFEDGLQARDFVHISDIVRANIRAMEGDGADGHAINVGTGRATTILDVANTLARKLGREDLRPVIENRFRSGDIRHCVADPALARDLIGFESEVAFEDGVDDLVAWVRQQHGDDHFDDAHRELEDRGLTT